MGFSEAKRALIEALRSGAYVHEAREVLSEKNLLAVGEVSAEEVALIIERCKGGEHSESSHHWDSKVVVHVFRPRVKEVRWYVKAYFLEEPEGTAVFISVHR